MTKSDAGAAETTINWLGEPAAAFESAWARLKDHGPGPREDAGATSRRVDRARHGGVFGQCFGVRRELIQAGYEAGQALVPRIKLMLAARRPTARF